MELGPVVSNDVYRVPVIDGVIARIRVQRHESGAASFRAEPDKGDADEIPSLAAIEVLKGYFEARGNFTRPFYRRYHEQHSAAFRDVLDAVTVMQMADDAERVLRDFQIIAASRIH